MTMKEILVLESWFSANTWHMRLVTDGDRIWVDYKYFVEDFWRTDDGMPICDDDIFNQLVPVFAP